MEEIKEIVLIAGLFLWAMLTLHVFRRVRAVNRDVKAKEDDIHKEIPRFYEEPESKEGSVWGSDSPHNIDSKSYKDHKSNAKVVSNETINSEMRLDGTDYSAAQIILGASDYMCDPDPYPSHSSYEGNGHGGDFGGGGASGSWDSGSDSSSSYDSGSSDSGGGGDW